MSLTKLLCKYLDRDGKGYVTIGDLIRVAGVPCTFVIVVMIYGRGVPLVMNDLRAGVIIVAFAITAGMIIFLAVAGVAIIIKGIVCTKIATCERKERDE